MRPLAAAIALVAAVVLLVVLRSGSDGGTVRAAFGSATNLFGGLEVRVAGRKVGEIASTERVDGQAVVRLRIDDGRVWPLRRGTTARIRFGTTVAAATRYVELAPGPRSAPAIPDGGLLTRSDTVTPVEFDELFNVLDRDAQGDLRHLLDTSASTFGPRGRPLARGISGTAAGFDALGSLTRALGSDPRALSTLVGAGERTARALASRDPALRALLTDAAGTFDELAAHDDGIRASLARLPRTLAAGRGTLARTDRSLVGLDALVADVAPGARRLRAVAPSARRAVAGLTRVAPQASATLLRATRAAPPLRGLLRDGAPFAERLERVLDESVPVLECVRPYGPELVGFLGTWAGFAKNHDSRNHYARTLIQVPPLVNGTPLSSDKVVGTIPGLTYAFPRPPGLNAGKPWFQPRCGAGPESLDPRKDPEAVR